MSNAVASIDASCWCGKSRSRSNWLRARGKSADFVQATHSTPLPLHWLLSRRRAQAPMEADQVGRRRPRSACSVIRQLLQGLASRPPRDALYLLLLSATYPDDRGLRKTNPGSPISTSANDDALQKYHFLDPYGRIAHNPRFSLYIVQNKVGNLNTLLFRSSTIKCHVKLSARHVQKLIACTTFTLTYAGSVVADGLQGQPGSYSALCDRSCT